MFKSDDIKVGKKVRCVEPGIYFGLIGEITFVDFDGFGNKYWEVYDDDGDQIGSVWTLLECFELITIPTVKNRPMSIADMNVGTKVVCMYDGPYKGLIGSISLVDWNCGIKRYVVQEANGDYVGNSFGWTELDSFNVVMEDDADQTTKVAKTILPPVVEEVVEVKCQTTRPCPSYYYGVRACTCGKCNLPKKAFR